MSLTQIGVGVYSDSLTSRGLRPTTQLRYQLLFEYEGRCAKCGIEEWRTKNRLHLHRIIPGNEGGLYTHENVIPVCASCHLKIEKNRYGRCD